MRNKQTPHTIDIVKQGISRKGNIQTPKSFVGECGNVLQLHAVAEALACAVGAIVV
jgi:hypothetical protein